MRLRGLRIVEIRFRSNSKQRWSSLLQTVPRSPTISRSMTSRRCRKGHVSKRCRRTTRWDQARLPSSNAGSTIWAERRWEIFDEINFNSTLHVTSLLAGDVASQGSRLPSHGGDPPLHQRRSLLRRLHSSLRRVEPRHRWRHAGRRGRVSMQCRHACAQRPDISSETQRQKWVTRLRHKHDSVIMYYCIFACSNVILVLYF